MTDREFCFRLDDDQQELLHEGPPPYRASGGSLGSKTLHARPTFWSPRQPPNRDWKTMAMRGRRLVDSLRNNSSSTTTPSADQQRPPAMALFDSPPPAYEEITRSHPLDPRSIRASLSSSNPRRQQPHRTRRGRAATALSSSAPPTLPTMRQIDDKCTIM